MDLVGSTSGMGSERATLQDDLSSLPLLRLVVDLRSRFW